MARHKGESAYKRKSEIGSHWITIEAKRKLIAASKRWGKSGSDVIEHCLRAHADTIQKTTEAIANHEVKRRRPAKVTTQRT